MPSLLRALRIHGEQTPGIGPEVPPCREIGLNLGRAHPTYTVLGENLAPRGEPPYAWYFPRSRSVCVHWSHCAGPGRATGQLHLDRLSRRAEHRFLPRRAAAALRAGQAGCGRARITPAYGNEPGAGCPQLLFLQLLFGYRSLAELRATFPDVYAEPEAALLLDILFPKQSSTVISLFYA